MASSPRESIPDAYLNQVVKTPTRPASLDVELTRLLGDLETRDKILIYAFGAFDRYYICWQDRNGAYRQERQGLPRLLDQWLFPADGTSRDLATLQVSLGHNDEFFAFDQYERISHINAELRGGTTSAKAQYPLQALANTSARMAIRRKSHTFSHSEEVQDNNDQQRSSIQMRQRPKRQARPWSIAMAGVRLSKTLQEKNKGLRDQQVSPKMPSGSDGSKQSETVPPQRPMYSDVGVQTDWVRQDVDSTSFGARVPSMSPDFTINSPPCPISEDIPRTAAHSVRSLDEYSCAQAENPVSIGLMSHYFRRKQYRLGDALIRVPYNIDVF